MLGIGEPEDLFRCVERGDYFACRATKTGRILLAREHGDLKEAARA